MSNQDQINLIIGATSLVQPLTGIGQYTLRLAAEFAKNEHLITNYFNGYSWGSSASGRNSPSNSGRDSLINGKLKKIVSKYFPYAYEFRRVTQQKAFNLRNSKIKADIYHEPNFLPLAFDGPTVITVHDLSYIRHPEAHPYQRVRIMRKLLPPAIEKSNCIIADSHFTKSEIASEFFIDLNKIHVTHLGVSDEFYPRSKIEIQDILNKYNLNVGKYVLTVGTLEPRKNLIQVISAYRQMSAELASQYPLVIVGMKGWKEKGLLKELETLLIEKKAFLLGFVPSGDLPYIYSGARVFVFPSLYEGFGLPPLEAMACGTPVISSNTSSIPEVVGNAGLTVSIGDVDAMKSYIDMVCKDDGVHARLSANGIAQSKKFSWSDCASKTIEAYKFALSSNF
jgi:glycosyltransferase involved in cell wall biosynthesis